MDTNKQAIATLFHQGKLKKVKGEFIPCDHWVAIIALPFVLIGYVIPLPALIFCFGQYIILKPASIINFYRRATELGWQGIAFTGVAIVGIIALSTWLFLEGWPPTKLTIRGMKELSHERKTGEYRYGLLITQKYLAIRCLRKFHPGYSVEISGQKINTFAEEPIVLEKRKILGVYLCDEYSATSHQRNQFIVIQFAGTDGKTQRLRLPTVDLDIRVRALFEKLKDWSGK
jgi:hypothetical protein